MSRERPRSTILTSTSYFVEDDEPFFYPFISSTLRAVGCEGTYDDQSSKREQLRLFLLAGAFASAIICVVRERTVKKRSLKTRTPFDGASETLTPFVGETYFSISGCSYIYLTFIMACARTKTLTITMTTTTMSSSTRRRTIRTSGKERTKKHIHVRYTCAHPRTDIYTRHTVVSRVLNEQEAL